LGAALSAPLSSFAQPTNFVVDMSDPNVDVDLSVLNDGGLSPQMSAPMLGTNAAAINQSDTVGYKAPGKQTPKSTLYIKPSSNFKLPPQTKAIEVQPTPQLAKVDQSMPVASVPEPVEVEPVPERLPEPEQVATTPPPAIETPSPAHTPAPKPLAEPEEVAEVAPTPEPAPMPEAQPEPMPKAQPEPAPEPAPIAQAPMAEEVAEIAPPPPPPAVMEPAPEATPEPTRKPTPPPQDIVKAPEPPAPPAAPPQPTDVKVEPTPPKTAALTPPPAPTAPERDETQTAPQPPKVGATVLPLPPKPEPSETASLPPASGPLSDGDSLRIVFDDDSSKLPQSARDALSAIADKMKNQNNLRLQLLAFAGNEDMSASAARRLSLSRALAVRSFLIESGVRSTRIDVRALGNKSTEDVTERVDITVVER